MKKKPYREHKNILKLIPENMDSGYFLKHVGEWERGNYTVTKAMRHLEILVDIVCVHGYENAGDVYTQYVN